MIISSYVFNILIIKSNNKIIKSVKYMLNSRFCMKNMSLANVILKIKILKTSDNLF